MVSSGALAILVALLAGNNIRLAVQTARLTDTRARLLDTDFAPGPETMEARLFHQHEIPWGDLAFRTVRMTLERFFADRERGQNGSFGQSFRLTPCGLAHHVVGVGELTFDVGRIVQ